MPQQSPLDQASPPGKPALRAGRLILPITLFVVVGVPLVAYVWDVVNRLFAGHFEPLRILFGLIALAGIALLLRILARTLTLWEAARSD